MLLGARTAGHLRRASLPSGRRMMAAAYVPPHARGAAGGAAPSAAPPHAPAIAIAGEEGLAEYRLNVGMVVINASGLVFTARRVGNVAAGWQMPQGGIDPGEAPLAAALRELEEETCVKSVRVIGQVDRCARSAAALPAHPRLACRPRPAPSFAAACTHSPTSPPCTPSSRSWLAYDFPPEVRAKMYGEWAKYRGQAQKWFLLEFTGDESEVNLAVEHQEFDAWAWRPLEELPGLVVPFKRGVYDAVVAEFGPAIAARRAAAATGAPPPK